MASLPYRLPVAAVTEAPEYLVHLQKKRSAAETLCNGLWQWLNRSDPNCPAAANISAGLLAWLTLDIDADIKRLQEPPPAIPMLYKPSPEELLKASEEVQFIEQQMEAMETNRRQLPEEVQAIAGFALPMFEQRLRDAREYRDRLQRQLEQAENAEI